MIFDMSEEWRKIASKSSIFNGNWYRASLGFAHAAELQFQIF